MKKLEKTNLNKLSLNKETIANLNKDEMSRINGGEDGEIGKSRDLCWTSNGAANFCVSAACLQQQL